MHSRGDKIDGRKKYVAVSLGVLGIALEGCIQHEGRTIEGANLMPGPSSYL